MTELLASPWAWWLAAVVLLILEVFSPGFVFLWLSVAAAITGIVAFASDTIAWQAQVLVFAALSVVSVIGWTRFRRSVPPASEDATLNRRGAALVGRRVVLVTPIAHGSGRARVGDTTWVVTGPDLPEGTEVEVVAVDGARLVVAAHGPDKPPEQA